MKFSMSYNLNVQVKESKTINITKNIALNFEYDLKLSTKPILKLPKGQYIIFFDRIYPNVDPSIKPIFVFDIKDDNTTEIVIKNIKFENQDNIGKYRIRIKDSKNILSFTLNNASLNIFNPLDLTNILTKTYGMYKSEQKFDITVLNFNVNGDRIFPIGKYELELINYAKNIKLSSILDLTTPKKMIKFTFTQKSNPIDTDYIAKLKKINDVKQEFNVVNPNVYIFAPYK